jgi:hypothetical protein
MEMECFSFFEFFFVLGKHRGKQQSLKVYSISDFVIGLDYSKKMIDIITNQVYQIP